MQKKFKISVIIPCYNEENTISQVIIKVETAIKKLDLYYEIIVVDDKSTDKSLEITKLSFIELIRRK